MTPVPTVPPVPFPGHSAHGLSLACPWLSLPLWDNGTDGTPHPEGDQLHQRLQAWAEPVAKRCGQAFPTMPEGVTDRAADVWEPLLTDRGPHAGSKSSTSRDLTSSRPSLFTLL